MRRFIAGPRWEYPGVASAAKMVLYTFDRIYVVNGKTLVFRFFEAVHFSKRNTVHYVVGVNAYCDDCQQWRPRRRWSTTFSGTIDELRNYRKGNLK